MRYFILAVLIAYKFTLASCQTSSPTLGIDSAYRNNLEIQLHEMSAGMQIEDYETILKFTYPTIVEDAGGKQRALSNIRLEINKLKSRNIYFKSVSFGKPIKFVKAGYEIHVLIPQSLLITMSKRVYQADSYLVGVTRNHGKNGFFIDF